MKPATLIISALLVSTAVILTTLYVSSSWGNMKVLVQDSRDSSKFNSVGKPQYGGWGDFGQKTTDENGFVDVNANDGKKGVKHNHVYGYTYRGGSGFSTPRTRALNLDGQNYWGNYGQDLQIPIRYPSTVYRPKTRKPVNSVNSRNTNAEAAEAGEPAEAAEAAEAEPVEAEPAEAEVAEAAEAAPQAAPRRGATRPTGYQRPGQNYGFNFGAQAGSRGTIGARDTTAGPVVNNWSAPNSYCHTRCAQDITNCKSLAESQCGGNRMCVEAFRPRCEGVFTSCLRTCP